MDQMPRSRVPDVRWRPINAHPSRPEGDFVLYWMIANRRVGWNYSLDRAVDWAKSLGRPLIVLEGLRSDARWASDRFHAFVLQGMADNRKRLEASDLLYYPYVEKKRGEGRGLLEALSRRACVVITDQFPCFFLPRMVRAAAEKLPCRLEEVDSNGLLPLRALSKDHPTAYAFRRTLQKTLPPFLSQTPSASPPRRRTLPSLEKLPREISARWPPASPELLTASKVVLSQLEIDHSVTPVDLRGGTHWARRTLGSFLDQRLSRYAEERNDPRQEVSSGLSPYLHFGHLSTHEIFAKLVKIEGWDEASLSENTSGKRQGWWGMSPAAESFLDELVTWRELGYNFCSFRKDYDQYDSLPDWARQTLEDHEGDPRSHVYSQDELAKGATHDPLWNAAQRQLVAEGKIHNYLRMLWGKKILEWSESPRRALDTMIELNNRFALDGRNPNSYSGIFWILGRFDRAWGPERPIFGKIRYMSSENTARKLRVGEYVERFAASAEP